MAIRTRNRVGIYRHTRADNPYPRHCLVAEPNFKDKSDTLHDASESAEAARRGVRGLDYDVLVHVMFMAAQQRRQSIVSALMRTCKTLHYHGGRILLSMTVLLFDYRAILSFTKFMLSLNKPSIFPHLRERIVICFEEDPSAEMPEHIARPLLKVLARSSSLRSLHIVNLDRLLDVNPDLCTAVSGLSALQDLLVKIYRDIKQHRHIARFFRALRCPLATVRLEYFQSEHGKGVQYRREADPIWLFASVASTLECIALKGLFQLGTMHIYPRVQRCHLEPLASPSVRPFITSFPALRVLVSVPHPGLSDRNNQHGFRIDPSFNPKVWDAIGENETAWEGFREANRSDLLANGCWESLDTLIAHSLIAYTFGLTCHIERLHLLLQLDRNDRTVWMVAHVLRDAHPHCLRLAFYMVDIELVIYMLDVFADIHSYLSELELRLNVSEDHIDVCTFLERVATALEQSNLTYIRVEIVCFKGALRNLHETAKRDCQERRRQGILDYCVTKAALESANVPEIIGQFMALIQSLRRMEIVWSSCYFDYGLERGIGVDLDVGPEVYDVPCEDYPDHWDAAW